MDQEMVDVFEGRFSPVEIDFDYEFDACRYFDFIREETPAEAQEAEVWFETAGSYPPSPFAEKLNLGKTILVENINSSPKSEDVENTGSANNTSDDGIGPEFSALDKSNQDHGQMSDGVFRNLTGGVPQKVQYEEQALTTGLAFYNHIAEDIPKTKMKHASKGTFPRSSTLMKPTASHLAKQNRPRDVFCGSSQFFGRSGMPFLQNSGRSFDNLPGVESQAAKRQKLEGGHLQKVAGTKQQAILAHKVSKKDEPVDGNVVHSKLKLTIPREPDLETALRAQRTRPKNNTELEELQKSTTCTFKARPLNRKILEAPSLRLPQKSTPRLPEFQEFHLKTSERALKHSISALSSLPCNKSDKVEVNSGCVIHNATIDSKRSNSGDNPKDERELTHHFKARPFNKKIFSSKGEIGVFRNIKREVTLPMEFKFSTDKRSQHHPPIELFNKLSLTSERQQNTASQPRLAWSSSVNAKGSKENTPGPFRQEHVIAAMINDKPPRIGEKETQRCSDRRISEFRLQDNINRSLGIR